MQNRESGARLKTVNQVFTQKREKRDENGRTEIKNRESLTGALGWLSLHF